MSKHILVISQYFYPEEFRINDICKEWVKQGNKVSVVTGIPNYPFGKFYEGYGINKKNIETYEGIDIVRLPIIPRGKNAIMLILNYLSFVVSGFFWQLFSKQKPDSVFIFEVSPMTQALPGVWFAKKHKIACSIYVQDLWPENVEIITGITNKFIINSIGKMVDYIYKNCNNIFVTSNSFAKAISERGVKEEKIHYLPQYAEDFYKPKDATSMPEINSDLFNIVFAGNIGEAQGLDILLDVCELLKSNNIDDLVFNIIGDGRYKNEFINKIKSLKYDNYFNFIDKKPATEIPDYMSCCDAGFISLAENKIFEKTIPAKLQSYLACGTIIVSSANGEIFNIVNDNNFGYASKNNDAVSLFNNISNLKKLNRSILDDLKKNSENYYTENFSKNKFFNNINKYI